MNKIAYYTAAYNFYNKTNTIKHALLDVAVVSAVTLMIVALFNLVK